MRAPLDPATEPVTADLRHARTATALAFGAQGLVFISLTTRLPVLQDTWDLGEATLSLLLLMMVLLAGVGSVLAETLARSRHSAAVLRAGLLVVALSVPVLVSAPQAGVFVAGLAAFNLALDFDFIERGTKEGLPEDFEWYAAFGLMVTMVWLYLEILRLLAKLRSQ